MSWTSQRWVFKWSRDPPFNALMGTSLIKECDVLAHDPAPVSLTQNQDEIQTFASDAPDEPFTKGIGFRREVRGPDDFDARAFSNLDEMQAIFGVIVTNQKARSNPEGCCLAYLLGNPCIAGVSGHTHMDTRRD